MRTATFAASAVLSFGLTLIVLTLAPLPAEAVAASLLVLVVAILCLGVVALLAAIRGGPDDLWVDRVPLVVVPPLAALTLWSLSVPGADIFAAAIAVFIWLVVGVVLVVRVLTLLARAPVRREPLALWTGALTVALLVFAAGVWDVSLRARFELSENAMNEVAREVIRGERDPETIERIGLWNVDNVRRVAGGMRFTVRNAGFNSPTGFAYQADGRPLYDGVGGYRYYRAGWYIWEGGST